MPFATCLKVSLRNWIPSFVPQWGRGGSRTAPHSHANICRSHRRWLPPPITPPPTDSSPRRQAHNGKKVIMHLNGELITWHGELSQHNYELWVGRQGTLQVSWLNLLLLQLCSPVSTVRVIFHMMTKLSLFLRSRGIVGRVGRFKSHLWTDICLSVCFIWTAGQRAEHRENPHMATTVKLAWFKLLIQRWTWKQAPKVWQDFN